METQPSPLFTPITINSVQIPNRLARSATHDFMATDDGTVTSAQVELYRALGAGGVGLIITGHAYVRADGKCSPGMLGLDTDDKIPGFARLAEAVHTEGPAAVVAQLNYGGAQVPQALRPGELLAPSEREDVPEARAFTPEEAEGIAAAYVDASHRARLAGMDGVQLHAAHGYFLNQTLSPLTNRRSDHYGGDMRGRARMLQRIIRGIRDREGAGWPILMKLACTDGLPGGLTPREAVAVAGLAQQWGLDAVEISGGMRRGMNIRRPRKARDEGFFLEESALFEHTLTIPVMAVHGFRHLGVMEAAVRRGQADMVSLCRPLIREPDLVRRFHEQLTTHARCISCNKCLSGGAPLHCHQEEG